MEFSGQAYWSELSFPPPGALPDPGIKPVSPALAGGFSVTEPPGEPLQKMSGRCSNLSTVEPKK